MNRSHLQTRALLDALDKVDALLASRGTALVDSPDRRRLAGFFSSHSRPGFYAWAFTAAEYPDAIAAIARRAPDLVDRLVSPEDDNDFTIVAHCNLDLRFDADPNGAEACSHTLRDGTPVEGASITAESADLYSNGLFGLRTLDGQTLWLFQPEKTWTGDASELAAATFSDRGERVQQGLQVVFPLARTERIHEYDWVRHLVSEDGEHTVRNFVNSGEALLNENGFFARETVAVQTQYLCVGDERHRVVIDGPFVAFVADDTGVHAAAWFDRDSFFEPEQEPFGTRRRGSMQPDGIPPERIHTEVVILPCLDSDDLAAERKRELLIPRERAAELGREALIVVMSRAYSLANGTVKSLTGCVSRATDASVSIPPGAALKEPPRPPYPKMWIQVTNETTLGAARRLVDSGHKPLALNFANGVNPGGDYVDGARAQEEVLCHSSTLSAKLTGDPMYEAHRKRPRPDSTDWVIYSPNVPVYRTDDGTVLDEPWRLGFVTCAAPYAPAIGQPEAGDLLQKRIHRVLAIARAYDCAALVLGAWGCGAFQNDPHRTARDFRDALEGEFRGAFTDVVFAIADWSPERRFLGPFRDVFS